MPASAASSVRDFNSFAPKTSSEAKLCSQIREEEGAGSCPELGSCSVKAATAASCQRAPGHFLCLKKEPEPCQEPSWSPAPPGTSCAATASSGELLNPCQLLSSCSISSLGHSRDTNEVPNPLLSAGLVHTKLPTSASCCPHCQLWPGTIGLGIALPNPTDFHGPSNLRSKRGTCQDLHPQGDGELRANTPSSGTARPQPIKPPPGAAPASVPTRVAS